MEHKIFLAQATDPPEYRIYGATSVPVVRNIRSTQRTNLSPNINRQSISCFNQEDSDDVFYSLLFSNKIFSMSFYDPIKIIKLINQGVEKFNYPELIVDLTFSREQGGTYLLIQKHFFCNLNFEHYSFENDISSHLEVDSEKMDLSYCSSPVPKSLQKEGFSITDYSFSESYKKTIYNFENRFYTDVIVNGRDNTILPTIITYDEFGIIYIDYYFNNEIIRNHVLRAVRPHFNEDIGITDYLTTDELKNLDIVLNMTLI